MPKTLKKIFEKEYMAKGKTRKEADAIFYGWETNRGQNYKRRRK